MEQDPVCGMKVDAVTTQFKITRDGVTHYFCSQRCKNRFIESLHESSRKGWFTRFLERIARVNRATYGDKSPTCCRR